MPWSRPPSAFRVDNFTWTDDLCGFPVTHVENGTGKVTVFFDQQANATKAINTDMGRFTITASANGKTLVSNEPDRADPRLPGEHARATRADRCLPRAG